MGSCSSWRAPLKPRVLEAPCLGFAPALMMLSPGLRQPGCFLVGDLAQRPSQSEGTWRPWGGGGALVLGMQVIQGQSPLANTQPLSLCLLKHDSLRGRQQMHIACPAGCHWTFPVTPQ